MHDCSPGECILSRADGSALRDCSRASCRPSGSVTLYRSGMMLEWIYDKYRLTRSAFTYHSEKGYITFKFYAALKGCTSYTIAYLLYHILSPAGNVLALLIWAATAPRKARPHWQISGTTSTRRWAPAVSDGTPGSTSDSSRGRWAAPEQLNKCLCFLR